MRSARRTVENMAAVVRIRKVERLAAEAAHQAADLERRAAGGKLDDVRAEHVSRERAWLGALNAARLDLDLTRMFAGAVNTAHAAVDVQQGVLEAAEATRQDAAQALRLAQGRLDAASTVAGRLQRRARRRAEEDRLAEDADRIARGRWRG